MAKILITCFGSLGDLFPYVALAKELQKREHNVAVGSSSIFQSHIEAEDIPFIHIRSSLDQYTTPIMIREFLQRVFDPRKGGETITRELMSTIEETYIDTLKATKDVDLVISNPMAYCTPLACREKGILWLSTVLAPMFFLSTSEPPILSPAPWLRKVHAFSPFLYRELFKLIKSASKPWVKPLYKLCKDYQLPPPSGHPIFEGQYSPYGTLAMFPNFFADAQSDWPVNTTMTGFPLLSTEIAERDELEKLQAFIDAGEAPIVFALGSSAVSIAGDFYVVSATVTRKLKQRAVLVCGPLDDQIKGIEPDDDIFIINYVAYDKLFPQARLIVHQGGIGTLAQSMAAQSPLLIVPFGFDQFDNGERVERLGIGKCLPRSQYNVENTTPAIAQLLSEPHYHERAKSIGKLIQTDDGAANASGVIEQVLDNQRFKAIEMGLSHG